MRDLIIDIKGNGDLVKEMYDLKLTETDGEFLEQKLWIKFKTFLGELWLNIEKGIPYFEAILVKNPDLVFIATIFKEQIQEEPLIDEILNFDIIEFDSVHRKITFSWKAKMLSGEIIGGEVG